MAKAICDFDITLYFVTLPPPGGHFHSGETLLYDISETEIYISLLPVRCDDVPINFRQRISKKMVAMALKTFIFINTLMWGPPEDILLFSILCFGIEREEVFNISRNTNSLTARRWDIH